LAALRKARSADPAGFVEGLQLIWQGRDFPERSDPDQMLYDGFIDNSDRALCDQVVAAAPGDLATQQFPFADQRLPELLFRYRARNFPDTLSTDETAQWLEHCRQQRTEGEFTLTDFEAALTEERARQDLTPKTEQALQELESWVRALSIQG